VNRVELGSGTAITGYTASAAAHGIGSRGATFPATGVTIYGVAAGRGAKTLAQVQSMFDDVKLAYDVLGSGLSPTNAWSFKRAGGSTPPASVANLAGADAQTRTGAPTYSTTIGGAVWGW
jgi:hypothetical protein